MSMSQPNPTEKLLKQPAVPSRKALVWQLELKRPRKRAAEDASIRMEESCSAPSGYCDLLLSEACQCPHLEHWLPNMLDLDFCKNASGLKSQPLLIANPIHALHLSSQLEEDSTLTDHKPRSSSAPWMYGEEQQRTVAFSQAGIPERFFPLTKKHIFHEFNTLNPDAPKPLFADTESPGEAKAEGEATASSDKSPSKTDSDSPKKDSPKKESIEKLPDKKSPDGKPEDSTSKDSPGATSSAAAAPTTPPSSPPRDDKTGSPPAAATSPAAAETATGKADDKAAESKPSDSAADDGSPSKATPSVSFASPVAIVQKMEIDVPEDSKKAEDTTKTTTEGASSPDGTKTTSSDTATSTSSPKTEDDVVMKDKDTAAEEAGKSEESSNEGKEAGKSAETSNEKDKKETEESKDDKKDAGETKDDDKMETEETKDKDDKMDAEEMKDNAEKKEKESTGASPDKGTEDTKKVESDTKTSEAASKEDDSSNVEMKDASKDENSTKSEQVSDSKEVKELRKEGEDAADDKLKEEESKVEEGAKPTDETSKSQDADKDKTEEAVKSSEDATKENEQRASSTDDAEGNVEMKEATSKDAVADVEKSEDSQEPNNEKGPSTESAEKTKEDGKPTSKDGVDDGKKVGESGTSTEITKEKESASAPEVKNHFGKQPARTVASTSTTGPDEKAKSSETKNDISTTEKTAGKGVNSGTAQLKPTTTKQVTKTENPSSAPTSSPSTAASAKPATEKSSGAASASAPAPPPEYHLSEARFQELSRQEEQVNAIRSLLAKRQGNSKKKSKKRKLELPHVTLANLPGALQYTNERAIIEISPAEKKMWMQEKEAARLKVERWLDQYRASRRAYWKEVAFVSEQQQESADVPRTSVAFSSEWSTVESLRRTCQLCPPGKSRRCTGDEVLQCLECSFIGCGPVSVATESKQQHILQHLFLSGHKFAVTCGARAEVFCFPCGDFVYHRVFDQERERLDLEAKIPWLAWRDHPLMRGFSPLEFAYVEEYGIVWRGVKATYPSLSPPQHAEAAKLCLQRQVMFDGHVLDSNWFLLGRRALDFMIQQHKRAPVERWRIPAPVGMYNLGNTCYMSSIFQCLINCIPLQKYFLKDIGHNHSACEKYRRADQLDKSKVTDKVCLACELDALFLQYYSNSTGRDVVHILKDLSARPRRGATELFNEISGMDEERMVSKGQPLVISKMLLAAWKSGGLDHMKGYSQRDAHEFMTGFLDILGRQICRHRARVDTAIAQAQLGNPFRKPHDTYHHDVIKHLFHGMLRSVLVCQECGSKRTLSEAFLNISLPLLNESVAAVSSSGQNQLNIKQCLEHFTSPESLSDPVDCPSCKKKTATKKQSTFSRLPRVLCVHLKRFHPALNKKIDDFVAFPAWGLNMGSHLPHWREVTTLPEKAPKDGQSSSQPKILYDLFGTVNHIGTLQSGHYVTNVKNFRNEWSRINDQHVARTDEASVLASNAYILFYTRR